MPTSNQQAPSGAPPDRWAVVDDYYSEAFVGPDPVLQAALHSSAAAGLPAINVAPNQGKLLHLLARMAGAQRILEIGTLGGYSTIWLARALPSGGRLVTCELEPRHAEVAQANLTAAGLSDLVEIMVGPAVDSLAELVRAGAQPFDLIFIDADKRSNPDYFTWSMRLTRPGSTVVIDNVVRGGAVADPSVDDPDVEGIRRLNELIADDPRVSATAIQTVGGKGYDGFTLGVVG